MKLMPVFDVIIAVLGVYILYVSIKMKRDGKVPPLFVTVEEMRSCKNEKAFVDYLYTRCCAFGIVDILFGAEGIFNDIVFKLNDAVNAVFVIIFIGAWIWFSLQLKKGKETFL